MRVGPGAGRVCVCPRLCVPGEGGRSQPGAPQRSSRAGTAPVQLHAEDAKPAPWPWLPVVQMTQDLVTQPGEEQKPAFYNSLSQATFPLRCCLSIFIESQSFPRAARLARMLFQP